ncbi:DUF3558 domain-containing protein [Saccharomonospora viridis]|jgi:hypothetical protein|uniref:DUF3558 domain-containing protein n=2 Tax=Saccharomonospora viridis TaxID=1852 RepID=UPI0023F04AFE|nr:DUF3558 domain-containing protein [Saccharomonospora viridis]
MPNIRKSNHVGALLAGLALLATGCATQSPGSASPADEGSSTPSNLEPSTSNPAPIVNSRDMDPCDLLSSEEVVEFGKFKPPSRQEMGGARGCNFFPDRGDESGEQLPTIITSIRDEQGVGDAVDQGYGVDNGDFNGRPAAKIPAEGGGCIIALALTDTSRVDVGVTGIDTDKACQLVEQVTEIVEPKLPGES